MNLSIFRNICIVLAAFFSGFLFIAESKAQALYCTTNLYSTGCSANDRIDRFKFGTITNLTTNCGVDGYSDYTSMVANVTRNNTYQLEVQSNAAAAQGF